MMVCNCYTTVVKQWMVTIIVDSIMVNYHGVIMLVNHDGDNDGS